MTRLLLALVAACAAKEAEPLPHVPPVPKPIRGLHLDWALRVEHDTLRIDYTITNATDHRATVVDSLPEPRKQSEEAIIVRGDVERDVIAFTRARVMPEFMISFESPVGNRPGPHFRDIPPGGTLRGVARTPLPLSARHNFAQAYAIYGRRSRAVLEIGYYDDPDTDASNAGRAPWRTQPKLLRGEVKPLPSGATLASPEEQAKERAVLGCPSPCPYPLTPDDEAAVKARLDRCSNQGDCL